MLGLVRLLIIPVYLVHKREVVQFKAVKSIGQGLTDLYTAIDSATVLKGQIEMRRGCIDTCGEYLIGVVPIFPAFRPGINVFGWLSSIFCYIQFEFWGNSDWRAGLGTLRRRTKHKNPSKLKTGLEGIS